MDVSVENTSNLGRRITVRVPDATLQTRIQERMQQISKEAHIKGFRPGKVPAKIIQQKFGTSARYETIEQVMRQALSDAINDKNLKPAGMPSINDVQDSLGQDLSFTAEFEIYPEFELADLSNIDIEVKKAKITDEEVMTQIGKIQFDLGEWILEDKKIAEKDQIKVNFDLQVDEPNAEKDEKQNVSLEVNSELLLPGLMSALIGKQKGDTLSLDLTYPETWPDKKVRGKGVHINIEILEVFSRKIMDMSQLNEKLWIAEGLDALKSSVREKMQDQVERFLKEETQEKVLEILSEQNKFELPQALINQEMEAMKRDEQRQAKAQGRKADIPSDDELKEIARRRVELGLLLNKVIEKKDVKPDGQSVRKQIELLASQFPDPAKVVEIYYSNENLLASIEKKVLLDNAVDAILKDMKQKEIFISFHDAAQQMKEQGDAE